MMTFLYAALILVLVSLIISWNWIYDFNHKCLNFYEGILVALHQHGLEGNKIIENDILWIELKEYLHNPEHFDSDEMLTFKKEMMTFLDGNDPIDQYMRSRLGDNYQNLNG